MSSVENFRGSICCHIVSPSDYMRSASDYREFNVATTGVPEKVGYM